MSCLSGIEELPSRWVLTSCNWSYNPYKWPYKCLTGVITLLVGLMTPCISLYIFVYLIGTHLVCGPEYALGLFFLILCECVLPFSWGRFNIVFLGGKWRDGQIFLTHKSSSNKMTIPHNDESTRTKLLNPTWMSQEDSKWLVNGL